MGRPGRTIHRWDGVAASPYWSLEYLPLDRTYNIVSWFGPDGAVVRYFCNVLTGQRLEGGALSYVDLDLDLVVEPDGAWELQDEHEFGRNAALMGYPPEVQTLALSAVEELVGLARSGGHLFRCSNLDEARERLLALYAADGPR